MSSSRRRRPRTIQKANLPARIDPAAIYTPQQAVALARQLIANSGAAASLGISSPLPRDPLWAVLPFNPGMPLMPEPINPPNPKTGRPEPRQYDYPVSWNLPGFTDRLVPWSLLRGAADIPLFRQCIETRKNEATTRLWDIRLSKQALQRAQGASPTEAKQDVKRALQEKVEPHIGRLIEFWEMPDRWNGLDIIGWLTKLVEEYFVLDAISIYPRRTRGGDLYGFEILDGSTIKPLLDDSGRRPLPPYPAYQQILQGFPRGEFIADTDLDPEDDPRNLNIPDSYDTDQLIYLPQHVRTFTPYGHSAVERALEDGDLWMQRHNWLKAEYTDGVMPSGWLEAGEGQAQWSPQQLEQYERAFNDYYAGLTKNRMRFRILPYGMKPSQSDDLGEKYKPDYDLFLLKLVAGHFDTTIAELGFTEPGGLGSAGWHEGQADVQERKADRPTLERLGKIITRLSRRFLDMPQELEFKFLAEQDEDENVDDEMWQTRVQSARATINEAREAAGQPRLDMPEADMPMVVSPTGFQFLEGAKDRSDQAAAAALAGPGAEGGPGAEPGAAGEDGTEEGAPAAPGAPDDTGTPQEPIGQIEKAELSKWRAWSKRGRTSRPFEFAHLTKAQFTQEVGPPPGNVLFKAAGDPPDPSQAQPGASWPGWAQDLQASQYWTEYLQRALTGGLTAEQLAAELAGALGDAAPSVAQVRDWLATNLQALIEQGLESVLPQIYVDGWLIGDRSAQAVTSGNPVDWGSWTPGDTRVARALVDQDGTGDGLRRMLDDAGIQIKSIAASQVDRLAQIIASGQETRGTAAIARQIDQALRPTGGRPRAQMIAQTELSRATNTATLTRYNERGVRTVEWHTAPDERVCPVCHANAAQGEIPLGHEFESGVYAPPAHPLCRCALLPGALTKALWDESKHPRGAGGKFGQTTAQDKQQLATANSLAAQGRAIGAKRAAAAKKAARGKKTPMKLPVGMYGYDPKAGKGSKGKKIQDLQLALNKLGVRDAHGRPLTADGSFTPEMVQAVMAIQKRLGWPQTGMVDSKFMTMVIGLDKLPPKDLTSPMMPPLSAAAQRKAAAAAKKAAADHAAAQAETAQGSGTAANLKDALNKADWAGHPALAFILQAELLKAWEAALHPRDEKGRFISVGVRRPRDWRKRAKAVKPGLSAADEFVKDSKVKHDLYHVTRYTGKMGIGEGENGALLGTGFYMHTRKEDSDRYLQGIHDFVASDARQLTMRADVRNPFEFTLKEGKHYDTPAEGLLEAMKERGLAPKDWTAAPPPGSYLPRKPGAKTPDELQDMLAMKGYDSILLHEPNYTDEVGGSQLVAFLNSQIRVTHDPLGQADSGFEKERTAQIEKAAVEQAKRDARNTRRREQRAAKKAAAAAAAAGPLDSYRKSGQFPVSKVGIGSLFDHPGGSQGVTAEQMRQVGSPGTIDLADRTLLSHQDTASVTALDELLAGKTRTDELPNLTIMPDGAVVVKDGNHRVVASLLRGDNTIEANINDLRPRPAIHDEHIVTEVNPPAPKVPREARVLETGGRTKWGLVQDAKSNGSLQVDGKWYLPSKVVETRGERVEAVAPQAQALTPGRDLIADSEASQKLAEHILALQAEPHMAGQAGEDGWMVEINKAQGFDGKPQVVSEAEMDRLIMEGKQPELWRGVRAWPGSSVTAAAMNEQLRSGRFYAGTGIYGNGTYTSVAKETAQQFAGMFRDPVTGVRDRAPGEDGDIVRMTLHPDAKIGDYDELQDDYETWSIAGNDIPEGAVLGDIPIVLPSSEMDKLTNDIGRFAAMRGYDAYRVNDGYGDGAANAEQYVVLNRTALIVQERTQGEGK